MLPKKSNQFDFTSLQRPDDVLRRVGLSVPARIRKVRGADVLHPLPLHAEKGEAIDQGLSPTGQIRPKFPPSHQNVFTKSLPIIFSHHHQVVPLRCSVAAELAGPH